MNKLLRFRYEVRGLFFFFLLGTALFSCEKITHPDYSDKERVATIDEIKGYYHGTDVKLADNNYFDKLIISGIVTADGSSGNIAIDKGIVIQDHSGVGIIIQLDDGISDLKKGDLVNVNVSSGRVTSSKGKIIITGISSSDISVVSEEDQKITPDALVVAELTRNFKRHTGSLVKIVGAHAIHYSAGDTFEGNKKLEDGTGGEVVLHTESSASFAKEAISEYGTYTGIAFYGADSTMEIWMRDGSDAEEYTYSPYPNGFPEKFDTDVEKNKYDPADVELKSGKWTFSYATLAPKSDSRPINDDGTKGVQFNKNLTFDLYLQMDFDVFKGASKVTILYGLYAIDEPCKWHLEYSTDEGNHWAQIGPDFLVDNKTAKTAEINMDIDGKVRFRVVKFASDVGNGRLNMDNFTIYNNF